MRGDGTTDEPAGADAGRPVLDRRRIVAAAVRFIDERGLAELTMRGLGAYLGVEGMALYRYVPGREALLDAVVEAVVDELARDPEVHLEPSGGWADYLRRLAHGLRRVALAHPQVFPLVATRAPAAPWVRPPLRSLHWIESLLRAMTSAGFSDEDAATVYRAFSSFLLGHLLLEVSARGVQTGPAPEPAGQPAADLGAYPILRRLEPQLSQDRSAADFHDALEAVLTRVALLVPSPSEVPVNSDR
jgi:AcrR family transcriptional regulator